VKADGLFATCLQHEIDHINGLLFHRSPVPAEAGHRLAQIRQAQAPRRLTDALARNRSGPSLRDHAQFFCVSLLSNSYLTMAGPPSRPPSQAASAGWMNCKCRVQLKIRIYSPHGRAACWVAGSSPAHGEKIKYRRALERCAPFSRLRAQNNRGKISSQNHPRVLQRPHNSLCTKDRENLWDAKQLKPQARTG